MSKNGTDRMSSGTLPPFPVVFDGFSKVSPRELPIRLIDLPPDPNVAADESNRAISTTGPVDVHPGSKVAGEDNNRLIRVEDMRLLARPAREELRTSAEPFDDVERAQRAKAAGKRSAHRTSAAHRRSSKSATTTLKSTSPAPTSNDDNQAAEEPAQRSYTLRARRNAPSYQESDPESS